MSKKFIFTCNKIQKKPLETNKNSKYSFLIAQHSNFDRSLSADIILNTLNCVSNKVKRNFQNFWEILNRAYTTTDKLKKS